MSIFNYISMYYILYIILSPPRDQYPSGLARPKGIGQSGGPCPPPLVLGTTQPIERRVEKVLSPTAASETPWGAQTMPRRSFESCCGPIFVARLHVVIRDQVTFPTLLMNLLTLILCACSCDALRLFMSSPAPVHSGSNNSHALRLFMSCPAPVHVKHRACSFWFKPIGGGMERVQAGG